MLVSLVLPCYNPPDGWERTVYDAWHAFRKQINAEVQLIVVNDGNAGQDPSAAMAHLQKNVPGLTVIKYAQNRGKGYAIRQGVAAASGDIIIYTDIDFPYTAGSLLSIYEHLNTDKCDVAIGVKDEVYYSHVPPARRAISRFLRAIIKTFLSMPITDTQCGLKGFRKKVAPLFLSTTIDRYLFDLEFVRKCFTDGRFRVQAVPVTLNDNIQFRSMNYRILLSESVNFVRLLFRRSS